jgi:hypothetical protein
MMTYLRLSEQPLTPFHETIAHMDRESILAGPTSKISNENRSGWNYNALLHSAHSLMIIVRTGIEHHRRTLSYHWDPQHVLPWVEGAISLSRWLTSAAKSLTTSPLTDVELAIISWVRHIMKEALPSLDPEDIEILSGTVSDFSMNDQASIRKLGYGVLSAWACTISQSNNPWPVVQVAGNFLKIYKDGAKPRAIR